MTIIDFAYSMTAPVEAVMFFMMFDAFFERRRKFAIWQYLFGVVVLMVMICFVNALFLFKAGNFIGMTFSAVAVSLIFYQTNWMKRIFIPIFLWVLSSMGEILILYFITLVFDVTNSEVIQTPAYLILGIILSKIFNFSICYAIITKMRTRCFDIGVTYWIFFICLLIISEVSIVLIFWMLAELGNPAYNSAAMFSSIGIFCGTFFALYLYERSLHQHQIIAKQEQFEQQMESQLKHMDEIVLKQNELRRVKHDMANQMIAIKSYLDNADISGGQQYVAGITDQLQYISPSINTGNNALDAILSTKKSLAESKGIVFNNEIRIQERLPLDPKDLCIIFGNALDNAIEACDRLPEHAEKCIDLLLVQDAHSLFCTLSNTAPANNDRAFTTSKADKVNHGFGLQNIRDALANYGAEPVIEQEGERFSLSFSIVLINK